ncbi:hypothetical protein PENTCL1PPCAC_9273, partial [Pristionchus entomophagus]
MVSNVEHPLSYLNDMKMRTTSSVKKEIFILRINGLEPEDAATVVQAESNSTVNDVIQEALSRAGKGSDSVEEFELIEEVIMNKALLGIDEQPEQRVLSPQEQIMDVVAWWNGKLRKFICEKKGDDPSSRGWCASLIKKGHSSQPLPQP